MRRCKTGKRLLQGPNDRVFWFQVNVPCPVMTNRIGDPLLSGFESEGEEGNPLSQEAALGCYGWNLRTTYSLSRR